MADNWWHFFSLSLSSPGVLADGALDRKNNWKCEKVWARREKRSAGYVGRKMTITQERWMGLFRGNQEKLSLSKVASRPHIVKSRGLWRFTLSTLLYYICIYTFSLSRFDSGKFSNLSIRQLRKIDIFFSFYISFTIETTEW